MAKQANKAAQKTVGDNGATAATAHAYAFDVTGLDSTIDVHALTQATSARADIKGADKESKTLLTACATVRDYLHLEYAHDATAEALANMAYGLVCGLQYDAYREVVNAFKHEARKMWFAVYGVMPEANTINKRWSRFVARVKMIDPEWSAPVAQTEEAQRKRNERGSNAGNETKQEKISRPTLLATVKEKANDETLQAFAQVVEHADFAGAVAAVAKSDAMTAAFLKWFANEQKLVSKNATPENKPVIVSSRKAA